MEKEEQLHKLEEVLIDIVQKWLDSAESNKRMTIPNLSDERKLNSTLEDMLCKFKEISLFLISSYDDLIKEKDSCMELNASLGRELELRKGNEESLTLQVSRLKKRAKLQLRKLEDLQSLFALFGHQFLDLKCTVDLELKCLHECMEQYVRNLHDQTLVALRKNTKDKETIAVREQSILELQAQVESLSQTLSKNEHDLEELGALQKKCSVLALENEKLQLKNEDANMNIEVLTTEVRERQNRETQYLSELTEANSRAKKLAAENGVLSQRLSVVSALQEDTGHRLQLLEVLSRRQSACIGQYYDFLSRQMNLLAPHALQKFEVADNESLTEADRIHHLFLFVQRSVEKEISESVPTTISKGDSFSARCISKDCEKIASGALSELAMLNLKLIKYRNCFRRLSDIVGLTNTSIQSIRNDSRHSAEAVYNRETLPNNDLGSLATKSEEYFFLSLVEKVLGLPGYDTSAVRMNQIIQKINEMALQLDSIYKVNKGLYDALSVRDSFIEQLLLETGKSDQ
jgi:hypothetical protein